MSKTKDYEIKIEGKEWETALEKAYKKASTKAKIDGFRPGKAPKELFLKKYGKESLYMDAADEAINNAYTKMLEENKDILEELVARPDIEIKSIDEKGVEFKFVLTLKPDVKLGKYKNLKIEKEKAEATKEEIAKAIEDIRNRYAENVLKEDKIENGDIAIIDFEGFIDEKPFEGGKGENYSLKIGSGSFIPGFEDQLIGLKTGDEKDVVVTFPEDYHAKDLKGKEAVFKVKIHEVKELKIPKLDKDFFADLDMEGVDSKETLEAKISENIIAHKETEIENKYIDALLEEAAKETEIDIPDVMIEEEVERMIEQYKEHLESQGIPFEQFLKFTNSDEKALRDNMKEEATKRVTYRLMLEQIAKEEKIEVSDEDANKEAEKMAEKYGMKKDEFLKMFGGIEMIKYDIQMHRAIDIIKGDEK
ncbi:MAG: trigger factor [Bacilli bacterium]|nr:trigger factor [Bacilli bacterium]